MMQASGYKRLRRSRRLVAVMLAVVCSACATKVADGPAAYRVESGGVRQPLTREPGDATRGRAVVISRDSGNCLLCHGIPAGADPRTMGNLAPPLAGVGARLGAATLRLRVIDSSRINRDTIMPAYYRTSGLNLVAAAYGGRTILSAQQVEDVVAYLLTLQ